MDKLICIGKNYAAHAKELGDAIPEKPVLFLKPPSVLRAAARMGDRLSLRIPPAAGELHHECEIVVRIDREGYRLSLDEARSAIGAVTLGLDMTLRERQAKLKKQGHPWEVSKAFLDSAAVGPFVAASGFQEWLDARFELKVGGALRQSGVAREMALGPAECVAYASEHFPLRKGDLLFTGTPAGVGPVVVGDVAELSWGPVRYSVSWRAYSADE